MAGGAGAGAAAFADDLVDPALSRDLHDGHPRLRPDFAPFAG